MSVKQLLLRRLRERRICDMSLVEFKRHLVGMKCAGMDAVIVYRVRRSRLNPSGVRAVSAYGRTMKITYNRWRLVKTASLQRRA